LAGWTVKKYISGPKTILYYLQVLMSLFVPEGIVQQKGSHHEFQEMPITEEDILYVHSGSPCCDAHYLHTGACKESIIMVGILKIL
jgi:hypothetical protein